MTSLLLDRVQKGYGPVRVIGAVSCTLASGVHLFEGANGTGKTTLLHLMAGLIPPTSGKLLLDGMDISKRDARTVRRTAIAPAEPSFLEGVTVEAAVRLFHALRGNTLPGNVFETFDPFSLTDYAKARFGELSLGWRKRMMLHMAFSAQADLLILDEPTAGLDAASIGVVSELIGRRGDGCLTVLTCHEPHILNLPDCKRYLLGKSPDGSVLRPTG